MRWPLVVRRGAQVEIDTATIWYEQKHVGLDLDLLADLDAALADVRDRPESFPVDFQTARRARLRKFPYAVFYVVENGTISVIAFLHASQSKEDRLAGRV